ncbi:membrane bound O-acyl transferase family-domain-containing protein [Hypoxylon sp. NC1633]|nr:membrane bound O-acyl transferase family-domain-containing protein [Hypoxylon sp. NC1633]
MECLIPITCYLTAVALVFGGLYMPERQRDALLPPIMGLLGWSIWQCHLLNKIPGISFQFAMTAVITILNSPLVLHAEKEPLTIRTRPDGSRDWNTLAAYKRMINPRMLPATRNVAGRALDGSTFRHRLLFVLRGVFKVAAILLLRSKLKGLIVIVLSSSSPWDFASSREPLIRRLVSGSLQIRELGVRSFVSLFWIVDTATEVELSHTLLRVLCVGVLALDESHQWPPMFGNVLEASTLKRFWGGFWHRLLSPAAGKWGQVLAAKGLNRRTPSPIRKMFVAFFIFTVSGIAHAIIDWRLGRGSPAKQILFYWSNFAAVSFEVMISKVWLKNRRLWRLLGIGPKVEAVTKRLLGFAWVSFFFIWITPRLAYPRLFQGMVRQFFLAR